MKALQLIPEVRPRIYRTPSPKVLELMAQFRERRRQPDRCGGCGREWSGQSRRCDVCREKQKQRLSLKLQRQKQMDALIATVIQLRREVTKLRISFRNLQRQRQYKRQNTWRKGVKHGIVVSKYAGTLPAISKQELSEINHAYQSNDDE